MKYLVDNQLPVALARHLGTRGVDCVHVLDVGLGASADAEIWTFASVKQRAVISKDEDFLYLATRPDAATSFVWVRLGNCRKQTLLDAVERVWPRIDAALRAGERVVELR